MSMHKPCYHNPRYHHSGNAGFTLIELLVVISIIGILVGMLLPTVQHNREVANWDRAQKDVNQIVAAENNAKGVGTNLSALAKLGLIDPTLGSGSKDGYHFSVTISAAGGFHVIALPAAPGITGAYDVSADQTGAMISQPSRGAEEARAAMFAAIDAQAAAAIGQQLSQAPTKLLPAVQSFFQEGGVQNRSVLEVLFKRLDADGDGKVAIGEIVSYEQDRGSVLGAFLLSLNSLMQLGLANEDVQSLPGVGLYDLLPAGKNGDDSQFQIHVNGGSSSVLVGGSQPAVALTGFCDGSVQPANQQQISLKGAQFDALLPAANPYILSGRFAVSGGDRVGVHGILIGLLRQEGGSSLQTLDGFFLVTGGSGVAAGAFGSGQASIVWVDIQARSFDADLEARLLFALPPVP